MINASKIKGHLPAQILYVVRVGREGLYQNLRGIALGYPGIALTTHEEIWPYSRFLHTMFDRGHIYYVWETPNPQLFSLFDVDVAR